MTCHSFNELNAVQKKQFIGELCHIVQSSELFFWQAMNMINSDHAKQLLYGVKIIPDGKKEENDSLCTGTNTVSA